MPLRVFTWFSLQASLTIHFARQKKILVCCWVATVICDEASAVVIQTEGIRFVVLQQRLLLFTEFGHIRQSRPHRIWVVVDAVDTVDGVTIPQWHWAPMRYTCTSQRLSSRGQAAQQRSIAQPSDQPSPPSTRQWAAAISSALSVRGSRQSLQLTTWKERKEAKKKTFLEIVKEEVPKGIHLVDPSRSLPINHCHSRITKRYHPNTFVQRARQLQWSWLLVMKIRCPGVSCPFVCISLNFMTTFKWARITSGT